VGSNRFKSVRRGPDIESMMMDPAVKTALAACVLLVGLSAATLLKSNKPRMPPPERAAEQLLIRSRVPLPPAALRPRRAGRTGCQPVPEDPSPAPAVAERPATVVTPSQRREAPPPLTQEYPATDRSVSSSSGEKDDANLPGPRTHKIVDGDTLPLLAQRYLGSAARAREIYEANRDVLLDPELLPIGAELKIPPRGAHPEPTSPPRPLTPVPHR
jgi:nucleoid-associated protein YgaU